MADFRKYVLAFAGIACTLGFTGIASAQQGSPVCTASVANPFDMRAEGVTEQAGDVVLVCTGGTPIAAGASIPQVNITVGGNANITSRLFNSTTGINEALLLIDEPGTGSINGIATYPISTCPNSGIGVVNPCAMTGTGAGGGVGSPTYSPAAGTTGAPRYNAFQGALVSNSQVTFFGVPFDPPATGASLIIRITNIRMNVSSLGAPPAGSFSSVQAYLTISASAGFSINNPVQVVGNVRRGLVVGTLTSGTSTTSGSPSTLQQCSTRTAGATAGAVTAVQTINFSEGFATSTKLRLPIAGMAPLGIPGNFQNTESQFIPQTGAVIAGTGLADFATRIKITINNVQAGVTIYVPTTIVSAQTVSGVPTEVFTLVSTSSETAAAGTALSPTTGTNIPGNYFAASPSSGVVFAVYEVTSQLPISTSTIESFSVPIAVSFTAAPATNSPGLGISTVNVDYAPSTASSTTAVVGAPIPRFVPTSTATNGFSINACSTVLLFPFMSNLAGFDTGVAIASTSTDPFGTSAQTGSCTLNFYGSGAPAAFVTPNIPSGTVYTNLVSTVAPGFQGYMIAQCRFQYGHGFAFITDGFGGPGRGLSEGYLALVIPDPGTNGGSRNASSLDKSAAGSGENIAN